MYINKVLIFCFVIVNIKCETAKNSLTFVIDDTSSMGDDIDQVKVEANAIFDTYLKSSESQIGNFIIVTFNDPGVKLRTITSDRMTFRRTLNDIEVHGGGDCPELSMSGIKAAIGASLPRSSIYVFTDAAAKDYEMGQEIARMAQEKMCQVDFVLTGMCDGPMELDYLVYHSVANKTNGQVFLMRKRDIHKILKYVEHNIKGPGTVIANTNLPAGTSFLPPITVDNYNGKDVTVAVSGAKSSIEVRDSKDKMAPIETIVELPESTVAKLKDPKPGVYNVSITAAGSVSVLVTARTDFHFDHGFSVDDSMSDATIRPVAGAKYHLWIKLNGESKNIDVKAVDISDMAGNVLVSLEMASTSNPGVFKVMKTFTVPKETFNIDIKAIDTNSKENLSRRSKTPITPQNPSVETIKTFKPIVRIKGGPKILLEGDDTLSCEVKAYPTPKVTWQDLTSSDILPSKVASDSLFDHTSVLAVSKTINHAKYRCIATNILGVISADVEVERKPYFFVVEKPLDTKIEYKNQGRLTCKADSYPASTVTWTHARKKLHNDTKIQISEDGSQLTIKYMDMSTRGYYICEIRNEKNRRIYKANVDITGAAPPIIFKEPSEIRAIQNTAVTIPCKIISGEPKPTILWFYRRSNNETYTSYNNYNGSELRIDDVSEYHSGYYLCAARNQWGYDLVPHKLVVEYLPEIAEEDEVKIAISGETVRLMCSAEGVPKPRVSWSSNRRTLSEDMGYRILIDNSLMFTSTTSHSGDYICEAENELGQATRKISLVVHVPIQMPSPRSRQEVLAGGDLKLPCVANGYPTPKKVWWFWPGNGTMKAVPYPRFIDASGTLLLNNIQTKRQGYYFCVAKNSVENKTITYFVQVNVPPKIQNYPDKVFTAVVGDLVLLIPCHAKGTPKPVITWKFNDELIPTESPWYDISPEGTLSIRNIAKDSAGTYTCLANNSLNYDSESIEVVVDSYPRRTAVIGNVTLKAGSIGVVPCGIPHKPTDVVTWFKNGLQITTGEMKINKVSRSDSGLYTCRVSTLRGAKSAEIQINVGSPPEFENGVEENINVKGIETSYLTLDCRNDGDPIPKVTWWFKGTKLRSMVDIQTLEFKAQPSDSGVYFCIAENEYGKSIKRFNVNVVVELSEVFPE